MISKWSKLVQKKCEARHEWVVDPRGIVQEMEI